MTTKEQEYIDESKKFIAQKQKDIINDAIYNFSEACFNGKPYDIENAKVTNTFIDNLISILEMKDFLNMKKSYHFTIFFLNDWGRFTFDQKKKLIEAFKNIFTAIKDKTSQQIIIEILSEYAASKEIFEFLYTLQKEYLTSNFGFLIPYGYKLLIENTDNKDISKSALTQLTILENDAPNSVKVEAKYALHNLLTKNIIKIP